MKQTVSPSIVCLAHLPWDFVWQRPQQILSRLAEHFPLIYINEPEIGDVERLQVRRVEGTENLSAWQPVIPDRQSDIVRWRERYWDAVRARLCEQGWLRASGDRLEALRPLIVWFYTPTPYYMVDLLPASLVVYDVMDELANFNGAGRDLPKREAYLLQKADLVFAGGRSLYNARKRRHPNIHLFPSGVQPEHFAAANKPETRISPLLADLPRPRLGYIGVIDERMDLDLLDRLAADQPDWSIVMVGPVRKIEEETLPRRPNIHYLGSQPYESLPRLLKGFDVCLMPFALNEATRSISPTKALEYMATHKPIVSSPVPDVVASWSDVLWIAEGAGPFAESIRQALDEADDARASRVQRERRYLADNTWEAITASMRALIEKELDRRPVLEAVGGK